MITQLPIKISSQQLFKIHAESNFIKGMLLGKFDKAEKQFPLFFSLVDAVNDEMKQYEIKNNTNQQ